MLRSLCFSHTLLLCAPQQLSKTLLLRPTGLDRTLETILVLSTTQIVFTNCKMININTLLCRSDTYFSELPNVRYKQGGTRGGMVVPSHYGYLPNRPRNRWHTLRPWVLRDGRSRRVWTADTDSHCRIGSSVRDLQTSLRTSIDRLLSFSPISHSNLVCQHGARPPSTRVPESMLHHRAPGFPDEHLSISMVG